MAWQDEMVPMLRIILNDDCDPATYTDERLESVLVVAAKLVNGEVNFNTDYTITVSDLTISPDPVGQNDDGFINLVSMKAACMIDQSTLRTKAGIVGLRAVLGPASLDTNGQLAGFLALLDKGPCAAYEVLKQNFAISNFSVRAILSPFTHNQYNPVDTLSDRREISNEETLFS